MALAPYLTDVLLLFTMCESRNLILAVKKYPCLWDIHHEDYHNRDEKEMAWEQVCKEVITDWNTCENQSSVYADLKSKWTNIRDYYRKNIKSPQSHGTTKKSKKYVYADMLNFLAPIFIKTKPELNYQSDDTENTQSEMDIEEVKIQPSPALRHKKLKREVPTQTQTTIQEIEQKHTNDEEDDDTKFLLSFRTYMRKMNDQQKLDFKLGMLQLVKKINMENSSSSSTPS